RSALQYDHDLHAGLGTVRPARAEHGQCEHGGVVHRQRRGEHGLRRDQYPRQGGAVMKPNVTQEQGFTLIEVIIAVLVLTVGVLGLVTSAALVTRMIGRGHRSAVQVAFSQRRLEMLRSTACTNQATGTDVLMRGGVPVDSLSW